MARLRKSKLQRFTEKRVEKAPENLGVYLLKEKGKTEYIGSGKIQDRLERHLKERRFSDITSFETIKTNSKAAAKRLEKKLIQKLEPPKNHTLKKRRDE